MKEVSLKELDKNELAHYLKHRTRMVNNYKKNFLNILEQNCIPYKEPCMINIQQFRNQLMNPRINLQNNLISAVH